MDAKVKAAAAGAIEIAPVDGLLNFLAFCRLPRQIYEGQSGFAPQLDAERWTLHGAKLNPHFKLVASAEYGYEAQVWPSPYLSGKDQAFRLYQRQQVELQELRLAAKPSSHDQRRDLKQAAE